MKKTIMFCFGGRRANLELQLPFIYRILDEHPEVEYHLWNTAKDPADDQFIRTLSARSGFRERFLAISDFHGMPVGKAWNEIYRYYAKDQEGHRESQFVKLDDDIVFIETDRFGYFLDEIDGWPGAILSAKVVNNGACGRHFPPIDQGFRQMRIRLLDVHLNPKYAELCHTLFLTNPSDFTVEPPKAIETVDWLSINCIGYSYETAQAIAEMLETPSPRVIAGRPFPKPNALLGDEGLVNLFPRVILQGFTVSHLTFGPQERKLRAQRWTELREEYAQVGKEYLACTSSTK